MVVFETVNEVIAAHAQNLITSDEARKLLGVDRTNGDPVSLLPSLEEAERVIRVISGWNPDRISTAEAIQPAIDYLDARTRRDA